VRWKEDRLQALQVHHKAIDREQLSIAGVVREEQVAGIPTIEGRDIEEVLPPKYSHKTRRQYETQ
jgi:hypothetical protein